LAPAGHAACDRWARELKAFEFPGGRSDRGNRREVAGESLEGGGGIYSGSPSSIKIRLPLARRASEALNMKAWDMVSDLDLYSRNAHVAFASIRARLKCPPRRLG